MLRPTLGSVAAPRLAAARRMVIVRSSSPDDTPGVSSLLARDRKLPQLQPELIDDKAASFLEPEPTQAEPRPKPTSSVIKSRKQRREDMAKAANIDQSEGNTGPKKCKEAIDQGLELFQKKEYQAAIAMFNLALELPGNAAYRLPSSPREYSCPSEAEENAALYNMACAYVQLGQAQAALTCLEAVLDSGFTDFQTMRSDPDLRPLGQSLKELVDQYDGPVAQVKKSLFGAVSGLVGGNKEKVSDVNKQKPWIMW